MEAKTAATEDDEADATMGKRLLKFWIGVAGLGGWVGGEGWVVPLN